jgi:hypothetical protein
MGSCRTPEASALQKRYTGLAGIVNVPADCAKYNLLHSCYPIPRRRDRRCPDSGAPPSPRSYGWPKVEIWRVDGKSARVSGSFDAAGLALRRTARRIAVRVSPSSELSIVEVTPR